jgi:hypothetical protein
MCRDVLFAECRWLELRMLGLSQVGGVEKSQARKPDLSRSFADLIRLDRSLTCHNGWLEFVIFLFFSTTYDRYNNNFDIRFMLTHKHLTACEL